MFIDRDRFLSTCGISAGMFLLAVIGAMSVKAQSPPPVSAVKPLRLVIAIDCSGSMKPKFDEVIDRVNETLGAMPEHSSLSLICFAEEAMEFAHTGDLIGSQRMIIRDRVKKLKPVGQWTNFDELIQRLKTSVREPTTTCLIAVFTDALSDPGPEREFRDLKRLLMENFPPIGPYRILLVDTDEIALPESSEKQYFRRILLSDFSLDTLVSTTQILVTLTPTRTSTIAPSSTPQSTRTPIATAVLSSTEEIAATVSSSTAAMPLEPQNNLLGYGLIGGSLLGLLMVAVFLPDLIRSRRLGRDEKDRDDELPKEVLVRAKTSLGTFELGPLAKLRQIRIGTRADSDVPIAPQSAGEDISLLVRYRHGRFRLVNRCRVPVEINRQSIKTGGRFDFLLPANIRLEGMPGAVRLDTRVLKRTEKEDQGNEAE